MAKRLKILLCFVGITIALSLLVFYFFVGSKVISSNNQLTIKEKENIANICDIVLSDSSCINNIKLMEQ